MQVGKEPQADSADGEVSEVAIRRNDFTMSDSPDLKMWRFGGLGWFELVTRTRRAFLNNHLSARCAQFAFYCMLALVPLLIITIAAIALLPLKGVVSSFLRVLKRGLPPEAYQLVADQVQDIQQTSTSGLVLIGLLIFIFGGSRLFLTIGEGLNAAFGLPPRHRRIRAHWLSLLLTLGMMLLLLVGLVLLVVGPILTTWAIRILEIPALETFSFHFVRWVIVTFGLLLFTSALYSFAPAAHVPWRWFTPGNVFAVAGWMITSQAFRWYVENFAFYNQTYGARGGVVVLLLWLYLTGAILFIGGQINGIIFQAVAKSAADSK